MSDFPDAEDEYELMYGDELENLRDIEEETQDPKESESKSRRSLDFSSPALKKALEKVATQESRSLLFSQDFDTITLESEQEISVNEDLPTVVESTPKRTIEDLFGEIDDINFDDYAVSNVAKKQKIVGEDAELALIERILEGRRLKSRLLTAGRTASNVKTKVITENLSYDVPRWPFIPLLRSDGRKVYVRMHSDEFLDNEIEELTKAKAGFRNVMGGTFHQVMEEAKKIMDDKLNKEEVQLVLNSELTESELFNSNLTSNSDSQLWVDRYKPKRYLELLSDVSTNKTVLHWLKMWDKIVFNREFKMNIPEKQNRFNKSTGKFEFGGKQKRFAFKNNQTNETAFEVDKSGAPVQKMALLCGPPGCGKTTLAHMIARHTGYNVIEVNASDDRSVEAFRTALENATMMKSVIDSEKRPNCLVLDEIDGAPLPTIEFLIKFCSGAPLGKAKKGQKVKVHVLRRPIICICNDPYAPALRPLRQVAFVVHFPPTQSSQLAQRLMEVAEMQRLSTDVLTLTALSEKTSNDIRSCLGVLHFYKANNKPIRLADILKSSIGEKDLSKGLFQVWQEIFQVQLPKNYQRGKTKRMDEALASLDNVIEYGPKQRFWQVYNTVNSCGDYDKLSQGVYENILDQTRDTRLHSVVEALDWFIFNDVVNTTISTTQNYVLYPYLPMAFIKWHFLFARFAWPKIKFPTQSFEVFQRQTNFSSILNAVYDGTCPKVKPGLSKRGLTLDVLPLLPYVLTPLLRPVNVQLYSEKERNEMHSLIGIMIDYNIDYSQERNAEGAYNYVMEPDILKYGLFESKLQRNLTYAMKQMISREIKMEKLHRLEVAMMGGDIGKDPPSKKAPGTSASEQSSRRQEETNAAAVSALPNHMQRLEPKKLKSNSVPATTKDFFGRLVTHSPSTVAKKAASKKADIISNAAIFYHYQEGFNNAVRRDVKILDLL